MAKSMTKKKNRRVRKQIRKTLGALFMASAIVVAAVPVQDVAANPTDTTEKTKVVVYSDNPTVGNETTDKTYKSTIPYATASWVTDKERIVYTSGDGIFQFVFMRPTSQDSNKVAVILGYNSGVLMESSLTIPEQLEAYRKYTDNTTRDGYCLVTKLDEFLHYEVKVQKKDENGKLLYTVKNYINPETNKQEVKQITQDELYYREDGSICYQVLTGTKVDEETGEETPVYVYYEVEAVTTSQYNPCYYEQKSQWEEIADADLYYLDESTKEYKKAGDESDHWKINANVAYIGAEKIEDDGNGGWILGDPITLPEDGIFANQNNITNLTVGSNILGVSDFAFYGCSTLKSVTLANGLKTLGNGTFANCINLESCNIADNANIQAIGKDAFYNCHSLKTFTVPTGLQALGDCCFEGCSSLEYVDMGGDGSRQVALSKLGVHIFRGCSSLGKVEFPSNYEETDLEIDMFEGCLALQYVKIQNSNVKFVNTHPDQTSDYPNCSEFTWEKFISTVPESFYFEGPGSSNIHDVAMEQSIAFKYLNQDLYEKIVYEHDENDANPEDATAKVTYQVNSNNELVKFWIESGDYPENVTIPEKIGPYGISAIGKGSFNDICSLKKITIPATVTSIGAEAFKGCHKLETVIFTDASTIQSIGTDAFKTQVTGCGDTLSTEPKLTFVGAMMNDAGADTVPFIYAMNGVSNINNSNQSKIYITCHSGWPTNLEVQYQFDPLTQTGEAQLVGYPRYEMINNTSKAEAWVDTLPYKTDANKDEYVAMVTKATAYYEYMKSPSDGTAPEQPTENEMAIVTSTLNVVIPASVDSIKPGLFSGYTYDENGDCVDITDVEADEYIQTILINGVDTIEPYTFKDCISLKSADIIGSEYIDNYAFEDCEALETVTLGTNLTDTGVRPFKGCEKLINITCLDSDFSYNNGVLYRNADSGTEIVECLESRGKKIGSFTVGPDELAGVTSIKEEAFADCDEIGKVDLSSTTVDTIPVSCFEDTDTLNTVVLPDSVKSIESDSFRNSSIRLLTIPGTQSYIAQDAFMTGDWLTSPSDRETMPSGADKIQQTIIFECVEGTTADRYAKEYWYINPEYGKVYLEHTVYFWDYPNYPDTTEKSLFYKVKVKDGEDAVPPTESPSHDGYMFSRWTDYTNISRDTDVYPVFGNNIYAVKFVDYDGTLLCDVQYIEEGKSAVPPENPVREGYTFDKWSQDWNNVTEDRTIIALYIDNSSDASRHTVIFYDYDGETIISQQSVNHGEAAVEPKTPTRSGYKFIGWVPADFSNVVKDMNIVATYEKKTTSNTGSGSGSGSGSSSTASPSPTSTSSSSSSSSDSSSSTKTYTVSVSGGSGSGSYPAGAIVAINAYYLGSGQNFDKWTTSTAGVGFANASASSTTFTMPAANVAITATYKTGSSSVSYGGSSTGSGSGSSTASGNNSGSSVQVTNPGISNTNLAGATVSGATDNFIVKVTEDQNATNQVVAALQARYGDITRIKYLAMDISLYDSTGRTKIADTSGISVNLTLPIPDDLVQYAGNNKVAAVVNGSLQDLNGRFTTVDGVPCLNFTATHFSPYVIYVDTANLTAGTIDATPKTGDPIHPKWFLAIGMACISLILFFKRDKAVIPAKTV